MFLVLYFIENMEVVFHCVSYLNIWILILTDKLRFLERFAKITIYSIISHYICVKLLEILFIVVEGDQSYKEKTEKLTEKLIIILTQFSIIHKSKTGQVCSDFKAAHLDLEKHGT